MIPLPQSPDYPVLAKVEYTKVDQVPKMVRMTPKIHAGNLTTQVLLLRDFILLSLFVSETRPHHRALAVLELTV